MSTEDRNANGTFAPGNPGGPGRPPRQTERQFLHMILAECPPETWREIIRKTVEDAKRGDKNAREWLGRYLLRTGTFSYNLADLAKDYAPGLTPNVPDKGGETEGGGPDEK